ncbi:hypothetical protein BV898_09968 [Hypsibius exemplaris]|uniref:E3 ubiquitin-protein ligase PPP1R11 n=1 Tax=Hypsibius exemplaris TaxID=2072580 RepID=A0A1W0WL24_HYPEX|nr:hypothetical protein BV898_09968 [Hypsibius exemplaris]
MGDVPDGHSTTSITETITLTDVLPPVVADHEPTLTLKLKKPRTSREVHWAEGTVDNEGMDKKKSKCCCIYEKPKTFDESSSESDDECEHCRGHVEKKKTKRVKLTELNDPAGPSPDADAADLPPVSPPAPLS